MFTKLVAVWILILSAFVILVGPSAHAASSSETVKMQPIPGEEIYKYLARTCSDESWKIVAPWAKKTNLLNRTMPAQTYVAEGNKVQTTDGKFNLVLNPDGSIRVDNDGETFNGEICGVIAQMAQKTSKKTARFAILIPTANAEELQTEFSKLDYTMAAALAISSGGIAWKIGTFAGPVTGALAGLGVGGAMAAGALTIRYYQLNDNRQKLEGEYARLLSDDNVQIRTCSDKKTELDINGKTVTIQKSPTVQIRISGRGLTGTLGPNNKLAQKAAVEFSSCMNAENAMMQNKISKMKIHMVRIDRLTSELIKKTNSLNSGRALN
jgi:CYTH domain-containing protein